MEQGFNIGDRVRWCNKLSMDYQNAEGVIVAVFEVAGGLPELSFYDVEFEFGVRTLFGDEIEPVDP